MIDDQIHAYIRSIRAFCQQTLQRRLIVLSGSNDWCITLANAVITPGILALSHDQRLSSMMLQAPETLNFSLGKEFQHILWDGFSSLNPDALGIASGLLKGGGVFMLLLPSFEHLKLHPDNDYARMCSAPLNIHDCHTFFLQRLIQHLQAEKSVTLFEEGLTPVYNGDIHPPIHTDTQQAIINPLPTSDQKHAITAIKKVAFGHRNRPLVIQAHRGRGKSSALGIAAAEIYLEKGAKTVITAPTKASCYTAFQHYERCIQATLSSKIDIKHALAAFEFIPIDALLSEEVKCHILVIDEAAALPTAALSELLGRFSRLVYSTTIHGYEGNGQGFAIRFKKVLDAHFSTWHAITLNTPIRWLEDDALEPWFFRFLLLNANLNDTQYPTHQTRKIDWISQQTLFENEMLFEQLISLLVTAHYQTSPSDIRLILDHPKVKILISYTTISPSEHITLYGVCLVIEEGAIDSAELADDIIAGKRRPRGQLFPQALCASTANSDFLTQRTYRIMRIAVHPSLQQNGIGSELLNVLKVKAVEENVDSLSTSYGLTRDLLSFWQKNNFRTVKLGTKVDGSSGLRSIMMMQALSERATILFIQHTSVFFKAFIFHLNRHHQTLPSTILSSILQDVNTPLALGLENTEMALERSLRAKKITAFAQAARSFDDTQFELFEWIVVAISTPQWQVLSDGEREILITQVLQNRPYKTCLKHSVLTGKKQLVTALRRAVSSLLNAET